MKKMQQQGKTYKQQRIKKKGQDKKLKQYTRQLTQKLLKITDTLYMYEYKIPLSLLVLHYKKAFDLQQSSKDTLIQIKIIDDSTMGQKKNKAGS